MSGSIRIPSTLLVCALLLGLGSAPAAGGQDTTGKKKAERRFRGEITVTATGEAEPAEEQPAATTVIQRRDMDDSEADAVADLLRRVPGLTVMRSGAEGSVASLFLRGTDSNHTLVLLDGVRLNSPYFGGYDMSLLPTAGLERVEVVRGPYSALWGADAVGGVVNLIPRRGGEGLSARLFTEGGEDSWARAEGSVSWGGEGADLFVSGFHREGEGGQPHSGFETDQWLLDLGYSWGRGHRIALVGQDLSADLEIPFSGATPTPHRRQSSDQTLLAVPISFRVAGGWNVDLTISHVERDLAFRDPDDPWGFTASDTSADTDAVRLASRHRLGRHTLTWGGEWRGDTVDDRSSFGTNLDGADVETSGAFVQDVWRAGSAVTVVAGARWDDADAWGSQVSPRVAVLWRTAPGWDLTAAYGEAFRQPSVGELYFPLSGNPNLDAETSRSWEVGVRRRCRRSGLSWELSAFDTDLHNLIQFDYAGSTFQNVARADITGAELGLEAALGESATGRLAVTWLDTEDELGRQLLRRPRWSGSLSIGGRFLERLRGDVVLRWVGPRDDIDPVTFARARAAGFATADLALAWRVARGVELTARILNLGDRSYEEVLGYPAPRRRLMAGLRLSL